MHSLTFQYPLVPGVFRHRVTMVVASAHRDNSRGELVHDLISRIWTTHDSLSYGMSFLQEMGN